MPRARSFAMLRSLIREMELPNSRLSNTYEGLSVLLLVFVFILQPFFFHPMSRSTLAFAASRSRISSRERRYSATFFLFCRRADYRAYKNEADNLRGFSSGLSALRLSVWLLDDGSIKLSHRNQGFVLTLGTI